MEPSRDPAILQRYNQLMEEIGSALNGVFGVDLKVEARADKRGMLAGRVYSENPHFGAQFVLFRITGKSDGEHRWYEVGVQTEHLPKVNEFSMYFPMTKSHRIVRESAQAVRERISKSEGLPVAIPIDRNLAVNAGLLAGAEGAAGALAGGVYGYLFTSTLATTIEGALVGGAIGAGAILYMTLKMFD